MKLQIVLITLLLMTNVLAVDPGQQLPFFDRVGKVSQSDLHREATFDPIIIGDLEVTNDGSGHGGDLTADRIRAAYLDVVAAYLDDITADMILATDGTFTDITANALHGIVDMTLTNLTSDQIIVTEGTFTNITSDKIIANFSEIIDGIFDNVTSDYVTVIEGITANDITSGNIYNTGDIHANGTISSSAEVRVETDIRIGGNVNCVGGVYGSEASFTNSVTTGAYFYGDITRATGYKGTSEVFLEGTQGVQVKGNSIVFRNGGVSRSGNTIYLDAPQGGGGGGLSSVTFQGLDGVAKTGSKAKFTNGYISQPGGANTTMEVSILQPVTVNIIDATYDNSKDFDSFTVATGSGNTTVTSTKITHTSGGVSNKWDYKTFTTGADYTFDLAMEINHNKSTGGWSAGFGDSTSATDVKGPAFYCMTSGAIYLYYNAGSSSVSAIGTSATTKYYARIRIRNINKTANTCAADYWIGTALSDTQGAPMGTVSSSINSVDCVRVFSYADKTGEFEDFKLDSLYGLTNPNEITLQGDNGVAKIGQKLKVVGGNVKQSGGAGTTMELTVTPSGWTDGGTTIKNTTSTDGVQIGADRTREASLDVTTRNGYQYIKAGDDAGDNLYVGYDDNYGAGVIQHNLTPRTLKYGAGSSNKAGTGLLFYRNNAQIQLFGYTGTGNAGDDVTGTRNGVNIICDSTPYLNPLVDDSMYLGYTSNRWKAVYAVNGTIQTSDPNTKDIEANLSGASSLLKIKNLETFKFTWKEDTDKTKAKKHIGLSSENLKQWIPEAVYEGGLDKDGKKIPDGVNYSTVIPVLINAVQELNAKVEALEVEVEQLKKK